VKSEESVVFQQVRIVVELLEHLLRNFSRQRLPDFIERGIVEIFGLKGSGIDGCKMRIGTRNHMTFGKLYDVTAFLNI
jgi:hypothetical protein